jgi:hypothetical protein
MADFGIYWKNFAKDRRHHPGPLLRWFTNSQRLVRHLTPGDRLWLFTTGHACDMAESRLGYLVEVFTVHCVRANDGLDTEYPRHDFGLVIVADASRSLVVDPPLLVDDLLRPAGRPADISIGTVRQSPWKLPAEAATKLEDRLRQRQSRPPDRLPVEAPG